ncbi:alpha/beta fold hydrolase [soil metagenome]
MVLALAATACVGVSDDLDTDEPGQVVPTEDADPDAPTSLARPDIVTEPCPADLDDQADRCGFLIVPEDRGDPSGPVIEMAFIRLEGRQAAGQLPRPSPLVVLPDGPGQSGLAEAGQWLDSHLRDERDIILIDPRGVGRSFPSLDCGEPPNPGALPLDLVEDCRANLVAQGIGLQSYDSTAIAADVADLARALQLSRINVLGIGHGAKVALLLLRDAPDLLRSVVLDSAIPPEVDLYDERPRHGQAALNRLLDECALQSGCLERFGDLGADFAQTVVQLDRQPAEAGVGVMISGTDLVLAALAAMRGAVGPGTVPAALSSAIEGDPEEALAQLQQSAIAGAAVPTSGFSEGLRLSVDCREEVPFTRADPEGQAEGLGPVGRSVAGDVADVLRACNMWDVGQAGDEVRQPVSGPVATLVLTGEFDPLSPPAWGAAAAAQLDDATVVQVGGAGHRVHDVDDCTIELVAAFLDDPREEVDGTCAADRVVRFDLS